MRLSRLSKVSELFLAILLVTVTGCSKEQGRIVVAAVNYPLAYFAERIGGEDIVVEYPVAPGVDPAFWDPDTAAIAVFEKADVILLNGAGYAKWVEHASLLPSKLVETSAAFSDQLIEIPRAIVHSHGPAGEHAHGGVASTTWLDFEMAALQARSVTEALARRVPDREEAFRRRFSLLEEELQALDGEFEAIFARHPGKPLIVSHPVYQYIARRYGLNIESLYWDPAQVPDERQWVELRLLLDDHPAEWMIWEREPGSGVVEKLESLGVRSVVFEPCGNKVGTGDFMRVMRRNVDNMSRVFQ